MAEEADDRDLMTSPSPGDDVVTIKLDRCYVPEFQVRSFAKALCPKLLAGVIFDVYDQHTQIITESDVKLNKWKNSKIIFKLLSDSGIEQRTKNTAGESYYTAPTDNSVEVV